MYCTMFCNISMCIQCTFNVYSIYIQCLTKQYFNVYSMYIQCTFNVYSMCVQCVFNVYSMCIQCTFNVYSMYIQCVFNVHSIYIQCLTIHLIFGLCNLTYFHTPNLEMLSHLKSNNMNSKSLILSMSLLVVIKRNKPKVHFKMTKVYYLLIDAVIKKEEYYRNLQTK